MRNESLICFIVLFIKYMVLNKYEITGKNTLVFLYGIIGIGYNTKRSKFLYILKLIIHIMYIHT